MEANVDPYDMCDSEGCTHELAAGVLVFDLLARDGPYPPLPHALVLAARPLNRRDRAA